MSVQENLRKIDAAHEAFNAQDLDRYFELYAESAVYYGPGMPEPLKGRAALREAFEVFHTAFPDIRSTPDRSFGQGDWVCMEYTITGTHTGPLMRPGGETIPPTNQPIRIQGFTVSKFGGGEITEEHDYSDQLERWRQTRSNDLIRTAVREVFPRPMTSGREYTRRKGERWVLTAHGDI